jgi:hypothetical protein
MYGNKFFPGDVVMANRERRRQLEGHQWSEMFIDPTRATVVLVDKHLMYTLCDDDGDEFKCAEWRLEATAPLRTVPQELFLQYMKDGHWFGNPYQGNNPIDTIRWYRNKHGTGLKESKDATDNWIAVNWKNRVDTSL